MNYAKGNSLTCRLCLRNDESSVGIFDEIGLRDGLVVKIWRLFGFLVTFDDEMPKSVCGSCLPQLEAFISFKSKVEDAQLKLQVSKLTGTPYDSSSSVGNTHSGPDTHTSPLQQPSTYGWDTLQISNNSSPQTYLSNSSMTLNSNQNPNKNTEAHTRIGTDIPMVEVNKQLPFPCGEENIKEVAQLWDGLEGSQDYLMSVEEHMTSAILDHKYDDIFGLCSTMQDGHISIKQFPPEELSNCTWRPDVVDDNTSDLVQLNENRLIGDYVACVPSVPLTTNMPNTKSIGTQTLITSLHYCSSLTCSKQSSPLHTSDTSSMSSTATSQGDTDKNMPKYIQNTDVKKSALDDGGSIPCNLWETNVTVYRHSASTTYRSVNKRLVDFYNMACQDCYKMCNNFTMLQRHTRTIHHKPAVISCCGLRMTKRQALVDHMKTHYRTPEADRSTQLELPTTSPPSLQTSVLSVTCPPSPISADQSTSSDIDVSMDAHSISLLRSQQVTSSVLVVLGATQGNSSSPDKTLKTQRRLSEKTTTCPVCCKQLRWKSSLPKHLSSHGVRQPEGSPNVDDRKKCQLCQKVFHDEPTKDYHIRLHHPKLVQQHMCIICNVLWASKEKLQLHQASVHGMGPRVVQSYKCPLCKAMLGSRKSLQAHVSTHTAKVTLKCPFCVKMYSSKTGVKRHTQRMHGKYYVEEGQENQTEANGTDDN